MECSTFTLSRHASFKMRQRQIGYGDVREAVRGGEIIDRSDKDGYAAFLLLGFAEGRALHVVVSQYPGPLDCLVVTVYAPSPSIWDSSLKRRRP